MGEHNKEVGINEIKPRGILKGPISYGITWMLVLLKVLPKLPRPIWVYMPKLGENSKERGLMRLNKGGISRVQ